MLTGKAAFALQDQVKAALKLDNGYAPSESRARGKALRSTSPREDHAFWEAPADRPDPVELLRSQGESRVQELLPLRYERMALSPFTFYRGAALIMASDLSHMPMTGIEVQACGDAHISNFGLFSSPERRTVFDINDFDETLRGPWEWDIKRLAASVEICARDNGFKKKQRRTAVLACAQGYREGMRKFAEMGHLDVWYAHLNVDDLKARVAQSSAISDKDKKAADKVLAKAKGKNSTRAVQKFTEVVDGQLRIISDPPVIVPLRDLVSEIDGKKAAFFENVEIEDLSRRILSEYRSTLSPDKRRLISQYRGVDIARKVVGVGSVGTRAWIIVMSGASEDDPLVLQVKEAQASVLERFLGKSRHHEHGKRVVEGQRAMQTASDMLLGWCRLPSADGQKKDYYVRQLWDGKGSIDLGRLRPDQLRILAKACGWTLAHAHARTGDRFALASYLGKSDVFDQAIAVFAETYADQNEADYARFMQALQAGEL